MTRYKLTRTGSKPSVTFAQWSDGESAETCLRACFVFCKPTVKRRLDHWLISQLRSIRFRFEDCGVVVERVN